ncbi:MULTISPECIES: HAD-IIA family hydrolase [unclassified Actinomyces]|uniref:HAD-IIA family hydrolase n=1 Tax=unclassified Actinomyces TaxID=2609248 RepID=UPI0008A4F0EC|nr:MULTISPECIES: HAD-IIA family hydrolase [unclassified Actinomyces]MBS5826502.1 HAD family hydrolase [Actinomyces sp.]MDU7239196.1 HAD-IIA family hydrolase [Actinomyces sp.]OFR33632.1 HAD family hydrolase [Actinomyces sp. HMSC065F11]
METTANFSLDEMPPITSWLSDMDGVLVSEERAIDGAQEFIDTMHELNIPFLVFTNNSIYTPRDLSARLDNSGLHVPEEHIWTSALATAAFLSQQSPNSSAFVIGEAGLTTALHSAGYVMTETNPEYVVLGETRSYDFNAITRAIRFIEAGAKFIATNPDVTGPSDEGVLPATGSVAAMITKATGRRPYFLGKPNSMMLRAGLNKIGVHSEVTALIGDRMDTDVQAGIEAGLRTFLVLSGSTSESEIQSFPFRPYRTKNSIADMIEVVRENHRLAKEAGLLEESGE